MLHGLVATPESGDTWLRRFNSNTDLMQPTIFLSALVTAAVTFACSIHAAEFKVDLNPPDARKDILTPRWENWNCEGGRSVSRTFGNVTVTFKVTGQSALTTVWFKGLLDYGVRMASDGISAGDTGSGGGIDMTIAGLSPGKHTVATYHNEVRNITSSPFDVFLGDQLKAKGVVPTQRATNDYAAASVFLTVDADAGKDVVIHFRPATNGTIVINGFEIDASNPATKAIKPLPANDDEHADADAGPAKLAWTAPASAISHDIYFGTNPDAVASATASSSEFKGRLSHSSYSSLPTLNPMQDYFWRADEVNSATNVTKGEVWRFRPASLAFPTAEGYGRFARGGRGGRVIEVTNLNDGGPGSLRAAVEAEGPRTVVFNVSGLITLESRLIIKNPFLTIAGQTAPGKGICIRKYNLGMLGAHDVIVRYLRVRPGNISGQTLDGMGMASSDHCIIDHCSISWTLDEAFSSRGAKNITLQRTLISEALNEAGHKKYPPGTQHGYAASIGGDIGSFHHNLLAHCAGRNWSLAGGLNQSGFFAGRLDIRNNVVYNWKNRATDGGAHELNFVGNYYKPGPSTAWFTALNAQYGGFPGTQQYYIEGNVMPGHLDVTNQPAGRVATTERGGRLPTNYSPWVNSPFFEPHVKTQTAEEAYSNVLANVGCNFPALDEHDKRVIAEVRTGTFKFKGSKTGLPGLPDSQDDVGGWEEYPEVHRPADWDTDHDGMPDDWEKRAGLNPNDPADGNDDLNGDGYTNLEKYLNSLVGEYEFRPKR
jgi:hypothetical protein